MFIYYLSSLNIASSCVLSPQLSRVQKPVSRPSSHTPAPSTGTPTRFIYPSADSNLFLNYAEGSFVWLVKMVFDSLSMHYKSFTVKCQSLFQIEKLNICF